MISGGTKAVLIAGILIGAVLLGGIIGAAIDYVVSNSGWWGVGALGGLFAGMIAVSVVIEGRGPRRRAL